MNVAQSCLTLCDPMDWAVHGILQARILEWAAVSFSQRAKQKTEQAAMSSGFTLPPRASQAVLVVKNPPANAGDLSCLLKLLLQSGSMPLLLMYHWPSQDIWQSLTLPCGRHHRSHGNGQGCTVSREGRKLPAILHQLSRREYFPWALV